jgi:NADPH:quinone reductase-like Zn-dependent oxidoreductase
VLSPDAEMAYCCAHYLWRLHRIAELGTALVAIFSRAPAHAPVGGRIDEGGRTQGTGGVSLFALQFAKMCGARVIATSSSDAKIERLKLLGADFTLNYKSTPDWGKKARKLSGHGVDLVVEVGGIGTLNESIRATKIGGTIAFIGVLAGSPPAESRISLMVMQQQRLQGVTVGSVEDLQAMVDAIATNRMKPVIDRTFPFDQVKQAFSYLASGAHFGKVAISIG